MDDGMRLAAQRIGGPGCIGEHMGPVVKRAIQPGKKAFRRGAPAAMREVAIVPSSDSTRSIGLKYGDAPCDLPIRFEVTLIRRQRQERIYLR